jgi:hypothetical protein
LFGVIGLAVPRSDEVIELTYWRAQGIETAAGATSAPVMLI